MKITKDKIFAASVPMLAVTMVGAMAFLAHRSNAEDDMAYLVTGKSDNKVMFQDIDQLHTQRVMSFEEAEFMDYYNQLQIGDTVRGKYMNQDSAMGSYNIKLYPNMHVPKISKINGNDAYSVIMARLNAAKRDSVINNINTKQK